MICPTCGERELRVQVTFQGHVDLSWSSADDFEVTDSEPTDSDWEDDSAVECLECGWEGTAKEAQDAEPEEDEKVFDDGGYNLEEGDWVTKDHRTFTQHQYPHGWRDRIEVGADEDWRAAVKARMEKDQFWPNVWSLSDHGNLCLLSLEEEKV